MKWFSAPASKKHHHSRKESTDGIQILFWKLKKKNIIITLNGMEWYNLNVVLQE